MPIPSSNEAIAAIEKVRDYLLNLEHPDGGPKAVRWPGIWGPRGTLKSRPPQRASTKSSRFSGQCEFFTRSRHLARGYIRLAQDEPACSGLAASGGLVTIDAVFEERERSWLTALKVT